MHGARNSITPDSRMITPAAQNARSYDPVMSDNQPACKQTYAQRMGCVDLFICALPTVLTPSALYIYLKGSDVNKTN